MGILDRAVDIAELGQRNLWVLWGKSGSGKTHVGATFPKPLLYIQIGDDGSNTIANEEGISAVSIDTVSELKQALKEVAKDTEYKSVFIDTFSMLTNEWTDENATQKKRRMTQQMWGDLKVETEECIRLMHKAAKTHIIIASCHEVLETIDGMEDEIIPSACPSVTKGARNYLEGMANYGVHLTKVNKTVTKKDGTEVERAVYAAHLGANPYYWTKLQIDASIKVPKMVVNPTYDKFMRIISGE